TFALASASSAPIDLSPRPDDRMKVQADADAAPLVADGGADARPEPDDADKPTVQMASVYFDVASVGGMGTLQPWTPDAPVLFDMAADSDAPSASTSRTGETIAPKGEVTGADHRPMSPAERLNLDTRERAKAEKCLANAIYFEARGEPVRGQIAVAQVV